MKSLSRARRPPVGELSRPAAPRRTAGERERETSSPPPPPSLMPPDPLFFAPSLSRCCTRARLEKDGSLRESERGSPPAAASRFQSRVRFVSESAMCIRRKFGFGGGSLRNGGKKLMGF